MITAKGNDDSKKEVMTVISEIREMTGTKGGNFREVRAETVAKGDDQYQGR